MVVRVAVADGGKEKEEERRRAAGDPPPNRYADNLPDFAQLASLYPSFEPYVFYSRDGCPRIDWTDFNSTRELTRVLLLHDLGVNWWIPDGQLCPTVPNKLNYIHWIEDLLALDIVPAIRVEGDITTGFDIGTGANCIYPLLGSSVLGWKFVGSDITDIAIEWANKNVESNPHLSNLIEIRWAGVGHGVGISENNPILSSEGSVQLSNPGTENVGFLASSVLETQLNAKKYYDGPPVLIGSVKDGEKFDFCMCNPPFFETMEEAGLNPKTSCGGTPAEMVCSGGEHAFIKHIIEDSATLKDIFRWYSSMVGRKLNLNILVSELWKVGATVVKTTEFVQGRMVLFCQFQERYHLIKSRRIIYLSCWRLQFQGIKLMQFSNLRHVTYPILQMITMGKWIACVKLYNSISILYAGLSATSRGTLGERKIARKINLNFRVLVNQPSSNTQA
ncbi:23S rRNA (adenine(1618)-N(6))-methyltransferase [Salvia divinorum]|uniref:23S rRNA (Adenine(1618)-N(6))-methyltransferase n=1 Tax=Salvia divinorum TaxID=28513 RepID=A0ABD1HDF3_SALDI